MYLIITVHEFPWALLAVDAKVQKMWVPITSILVATSHSIQVLGKFNFFFLSFLVCLPKNANEKADFTSVVLLGKYHVCIARRTSFTLVCNARLMVFDGCMKGMC